MHTNTHSSTFIIESNQKKEAFLYEFITNNWIQFTSTWLTAERSVNGFEMRNVLIKDRFYTVCRMRIKFHFVHSVSLFVELFFLPFFSLIYSLSASLSYLYKIRMRYGERLSFEFISVVYTYKCWYLSRFSHSLAVWMSYGNHHGLIWDRLELFERGRERKKIWILL